MPEFIRLRSPGLLEFTGSRGEINFGARQTWYEESFQRKAGCGPLTASQLIWYISHAPDKERDILPLMREMWRYVKPGILGVNTTGKFAGGLRRYAAARGLPLTVERLPVPFIKRFRPPPEQVAAFVANALSADVPVAFLNLSRGRLRNLDGWHWVTLVAVCPATLSAVMYDNGGQTQIDLQTWLATSALGGGFVAVRPG